MLTNFHKRSEYFNRILVELCTDWLNWFLNCLDHALESSNETLSEVLQKARFWELHANTVLNPRQHQMINRLLDGFEGKLTSSKWAKLTKTSPDTALRDITDLLNKKVLVKEVGGGRSTSYGLRVDDIITTS
jgi:Fic family protein